jgi:hypothetical protein
MHTGNLKLVNSLPLAVSGIRVRVHWQRRPAAARTTPRGTLWHGALQAGALTLAFKFKLAPTGMPMAPRARIWAASRCLLALNKPNLAKLARGPAAHWQGIFDLDSGGTALNQR